MGFHSNALAHDRTMHIGECGDVAVGIATRDLNKGSVDEWNVER